MGLLHLLGAYNNPFWHFALSISILKLHSRVLHNTAPPHLTSLYNVPSVDTGEGFTQSRPVAVVPLKAGILWLVFLWTVWHFHLVALSFSFSHFVGWNSFKINVTVWLTVWLNLTADRFSFFFFSLSLILYCIKFSTEEGLSKRQSAPKNK